MITSITADKNRNTVIYNGQEMDYVYYRTNNNGQLQLATLVHQKYKNTSLPYSIVLTANITNTMTVYPNRINQNLTCKLTANWNTTGNTTNKNYISTYTPRLCSITATFNGSNLGTISFYNGYEGQRISGTTTLTSTLNTNIKKSIPYKTYSLYITYSYAVQSDNFADEPTYVSVSDSLSLYVNTVNTLSSNKTILISNTLQTMVQQ